MFAWLSARRRRQLAAQPFPVEWDAIIDRNVVAATRLSAAARARLRELVAVFIAEKYWEGCGGLDLTEEMQVTIAAQACLLVLGRDDTLYSDVASILVYPTTIVTPPRRLGTFEQARAPVGHGRALLGEAHLRGPVVLAWDAVLAGGREDWPGNVVFHEFAHKLDMENGAIDGTPPLPSRRDEKRWAAVCASAFAQHRARVAADVPTAIDAYGATDEAEFFAVATETYFRRPYELAAEYPALYIALAEFYKFESV